MKITSELDAILFLRYLGEGVENLQKGKKIRRSFTKIQLVYQIFLLSKNVDRGVWKAIFTSYATIARYCKMSVSSVKRFFTSEEHQSFISVSKAPFKSHTYKIKDIFKHVIEFLECKGYFKGIVDDPAKWKDYFASRLDKHIIPCLESGMTLAQIHSMEMNKLSTKKKAKRATEKIPKRATTTLRFLTTLRNQDKVPANRAEIEKIKEREAFQELNSIPLTFSQKERLSATWSINSLREAKKDFIFYSHYNKVLSPMGFIASQAKYHTIKLLKKMKK